jgi:prolyl oligopeptidase
MTEEYFGTKVSYPYRYMEELGAPEVQRWFKQQDAYTRPVLLQIPGRATLLEKIRQFDQTGPARILSLQRFEDDRIYYEKRLPVRMWRNCMFERGSKAGSSYWWILTGTSRRQANTSR